MVESHSCEQWRPIRALIKILELFQSLFLLFLFPFFFYISCLYYLGTSSLINHHLIPFVWVAGMHCVLDIVLLDRIEGQVGRP